MEKNLLIRTAAIASCVIVGACATTTPDMTPTESSRPVEPPAARPPSIAPGVVGTAPIAPTTSPPTASPPPASPPAASPPSAKAAAVSASRESDAPRNLPKPAASAKPEAKAAAAANPAPSVPVKTETPSQATGKAEPTLDVADLKARLGETKAIGVFTKLALKNQMDDLLQRFRKAYQGGQKPSVGPLRQPFDELVAKVLSQLRPGDPALARTIENSREAIWGILSDPEKFKSVT